MSRRPASNIKSCIFSRAVISLHAMAAPSLMQSLFHWWTLGSFLGFGPYINTWPSCFTSWCLSASSSFSGAPGLTCLPPIVVRMKWLIYRKCLNGTWRTETLGKALTSIMTASKRKLAHLSFDQCAGIYIRINFEKCNYSIKGYVQINFVSFFCFLGGAYFFCRSVWLVGS